MGERIDVDNRVTDFKEEVKMRSERSPARNGANAARHETGGEAQPEGAAAGQGVDAADRAASFAVLASTDAPHVTGSSSFGVLPFGGSYFGVHRSGGSYFGVHPYGVAYFGVHPYGGAYSVHLYGAWKRKVHSGRAAQRTHDDYHLQKLVTSLISLE
ncbi:hypothetical protein AVEN_261708-1 [Araneus ventricosus]|uniref:Uncharacterized protein n=1 Tax=Araneus ventricosus TaxID=182803 RepID=A0A4Y2DW69_ARAVE|nr:hypothetical protein AVEN_261708-1 [Araneus ventricosus]